MTSEPLTLMKKVEKERRIRASLINADQDRYCSGTALSKSPGKVIRASGAGAECGDYRPGVDLLGRIDLSASSRTGARARTS